MDKWTYTAKSGDCPTLETNIQASVYLKLPSRWVLCAGGAGLARTEAQRRPDAWILLTYYSFTAPDVMPPTIYFCPIRYTITTGRQVNTISANI